MRVGSIVRVDLHGRRIRAWVVALGSTPPASVTLKAIAKVTGWGPPPDVVDLAGWAAWRWAGPVSAFLGTASPPGAVTALPRPMDHAPEPATNRPQIRRQSIAGSAVAGRALEAGRAVVGLPPAADPLPFAIAAAGLGNALVVVPSLAQARHVSTGLRAAGVGVASVPTHWPAAAAGATVVGARAAAWAPVRALGAVVVVDEHDEGLQEERAPTWHARDVAVERARRAGVPAVLLSPCPSLEALVWGEPFMPSTDDARAGWPVVDVVDRRREDPRTGLFSERLASLARDRSRGRVVCVLNRTGRARLLACAACGAVATCEQCGAAVGQPGEERELECLRCGMRRPVVCRGCGAGKFRTLRAGVSRVREELEALVGEPVGEVTAATRTTPEARVVVGTEAVLHQVAAGDVGVVALLDLDQELLAPRYRASEQALALVARSARLLGGRAEGGRLVLQTRQPRHPVVLAALLADPNQVAAAERPVRESLRFPPFSAMAAVSGSGAEAYLDALGSPLGIEVIGPADGRWLLRAPDHRTLCDALAATPRPAARLRVEVDPLRV